MANYRYQNPATTDATQACQQCESIYISLGRPICADFCDGVGNYAISDQIISPNNYASMQIGDILIPDEGEPNFTADDFYAYAAESTTTSNPNVAYRILKIDPTIPNRVASLRICGSDGTGAPVCTNP
jgi:hypothetical protein